MRALFLLHNHPERGSHFRAREIAVRLAARGHAVTIVTTSDRRYYRPTHRGARGIGDRGGTLAEIEAPCRTLFNDRQEGWSLFDNGYRLGLALGGEKWDLVYGFSHKPDCLLAGLAAKLRGARLVLDWSDWWGGAEGLYQSCVLESEAFLAMPAPVRAWRRATFAADSFLEPRAYAFASAVTLISEEFLSHPGAPRDLPEKSLVMHSGAPLEQVRPVPAAEARAACGIELPPGAVVLGYVANFHTDERLLLEAFAEVCRVRGDVHLLVVGAGFEKGAAELHEACRGRIHHRGRKPFCEIGAHLCAADILLLPLTDLALNRARYPHKLSDYVAAGRPIVACDVGETGRLLRRYGIGEMTGPTAPEFAKGILDLATRPDAWLAKGRQVRDAAESHFNWDRLCDGLFGFLSDRLSLQL